MSANQYPPLVLELAEGVFGSVVSAFVVSDVVVTVVVTDVVVSGVVVVGMSSVKKRRDK